MPRTTHAPPARAGDGAAAVTPATPPSTATTGSVMEPAVRRVVLWRVWRLLIIGRRFLATNLRCRRRRHGATSAGDPEGAPTIPSDSHRSSCSPAVDREPRSRIRHQVPPGSMPPRSSRYPTSPSGGRSLRAIHQHAHRPSRDAKCRGERLRGRNVIGDERDSRKGFGAGARSAIAGIAAVSADRRLLHLEGDPREHRARAFRARRWHTAASEPARQ